MNTAKGPDVIDYKLQKVDVRIYGSVALVQATGLWAKEDKSNGVSRYIDVYVRAGARCKAVPARITRASQTME